MKIRSLLLATAIVSGVTGFAFAQNSPAKPETGNVAPGANVNSNAPPDQNAPRAGAMKSAPTTGSNVKESKEKEISPASPDAGLKQQK